MTDMPERSMKPSEIAAALSDEERKSRLMAAIKERRARRETERAAWATKTDMPERIFAASDHGPSYSGTWIASFSDGSEYIRADLVAAKDAEIDRLREDLAQAEADRLFLVDAIRTMDTNNAQFDLGELFAIEARARKAEG